MAEGILHKIYDSEVKEYNDESLTITHFISTEQVDRSKDIVRADGVEFDGVPVVLKQHGFDPVVGSEPIAKPINITVGINSSGIKGILCTTQYYDGSKLIPPDNTGRRLYEKAKERYMPYFSIGYRIIEADPRQGGGLDIRKCVVFEYSQVGVPDNVGAEFVKTIEDRELLEKTAKEIVMFTFVKKEALKPSPLCKSISDRISGRINCLAIETLFQGLMEELVFSEGGKEIASAALAEFVTLALPYAEGLIDEFAMKSKEDKNTLHKRITTRQANAEEHAPLAIPAIDSSNASGVPVETTYGNTVRLKLSPPDTQKGNPANTERKHITVEQIRNEVAESVSKNLASALNKLRGKISN